MLMTLIFVFLIFTVIGYAYTRFRGGSSSDSESVELEDRDPKADANALLSYTSDTRKLGDERSSIMSESKKGKKEKGKKLVTFNASVPKQAPKEYGQKSLRMQHSILDTLEKRVKSLREEERNPDLIIDVNNRPELDLEDDGAVKSYIQTWKEENEKLKPRRELFQIEERGIKNGKMTYETVWKDDAL